MHKPNLQDCFLNLIRKDNFYIVVYLINGAQVRGVLKGFDNFTVIVEHNGKQNLIYKHAISTIVPQERVEWQPAFEKDV